MDYKHKETEEKWKKYWTENNTYKVTEDYSKPKYYVLDMFPYPSGAGLHVGHPLGYIASDIIARYKKMKGFQVLHPMGFDAFGLPAEQYAIQTGVHPEISTHQNIQRYKEQLNNIGMNYDWSREVITCDPEYYQWTQWIFLQLFSHYYNIKLNKAKPIDELIQYFKSHGNIGADAFGSTELKFTAEDWNKMSEKEKDLCLMNYRLAYRKESFVNWCEALGTVLANDEIKDGVSERGGHPVEKKPMMQWALRISAYAERLLSDLETLDWSDSMKTMQKNWIGKSSGAQINFKIKDSNQKLEIFTTRPDTIFGVSFMVIAPEHEMLKELTSSTQHQSVQEYLIYVKNRSEFERVAETKIVSGVFSGSYCIHPFTGREIQIWISDYVLIEYGTGAIMGVPSNDRRDFQFATKYNLPITNIIDQSNFPNADIEDKVGTLVQSDFLNGLSVLEAFDKVVSEIEKNKIGYLKNQFRLRDSNFSRQRYWGEPIPVAYTEDGVCIPLSEKDLPLTLPRLEKIVAGSNGKSPLMHAINWSTTSSGLKRELDTMPGYAGSSWYFLRYMDPSNKDSFGSRKLMDYWQNVDLYIGGTEHAVGHLLYSRFWHKFLFDIGYVSSLEPFQKLVNQGMIQGIIENIYLIKDSTPPHFISADLAKGYPRNELALIPVYVGFVSLYNSSEAHLNKQGLLDFVKWKPDFLNAIFSTSAGTYTIDKLPDDIKFMTQSEVGKMSKRYHNVVNPDDVIEEYGADVFRMYEMFLGPLQDSKPWDTKGITGVAGFIKKYYRFFFNEQGKVTLSDLEPSKEELKTLHACIKKVSEDINNLSFNTSISSFMICVNELKKLNCNNRKILLSLNSLLAPFAPFITEEIYHCYDGVGSIHHQEYPIANDSYLIKDTVQYPVSINGKKRYEWIVSQEMSPKELESEVIKIDEIQKWLENAIIQKIIIVPGRMINLVIQERK